MPGSAATSSGRSRAASAGGAASRTSPAPSRYNTSTSCASSPPSRCERFTVRVVRARTHSVLSGRAQPVVKPTRVAIGAASANASGSSLATSAAS
jgi:hypothetical protein